MKRSCRLSVLGRFRTYRELDTSVFPSQATSQKGEQLFDLFANGFVDLINQVVNWKRR